LASSIHVTQGANGGNLTFVWHPGHVGTIILTHLASTMKNIDQVVLYSSAPLSNLASMPIMSVDDGNYTHDTNKDGIETQTFDYRDKTVTINCLNYPVPKIPKKGDAYACTATISPPFKTPPILTPVTYPLVARDLKAGAIIKVLAVLESQDSKTTTDTNVTSATLSVPAGGFDSTHKKWIINNDPK